MLQKHFLLALDSDTPDEFLEPGSARHKLNLIPKNEASTESPSQETIKGNTPVSITLSDPHSRTIGSVVDESNNRIIFFNYSPLNKHEIWSYDARSGVSTLIYQDPALEFWYTGRMKARVIDGNLIFTHGRNPERMINIDDAIAGKYKYRAGTTTELTSSQKKRLIQLYKASPSFAPLTSKTNTGSTAYNQVSDYNFQFAYRYLFTDDTVSAFSEISDLVPAQKKPFSFRDSETYYNTISLSVFFPKGMENIIDKIDICYRIGNYGQFKIYDSIKTDGYTDTIITPGVPSSLYYTLQTQFKNDKAGTPISDEEIIKPYEAMPRLSNSLELMQSRAFLVEDKTGFDYDDSVALTVTTQYSNDNGLNNLHSKYFKEKAAYNFAIQFFDEQGRKSAAKSVVKYEFGRSTGTGIGNIALQRPIARVSVVGQAPTWAKKWQIVRTKDKTHDVYVQFVGRILYYVSEYNPEDPPSGWEASLKTKYDPIVIDGKVYRKSAPASAADEFTYLHIQLPNNMPIEVDSSYMARVLRHYAIGSVDTNTSFRILDVVDDKIVIDNLNPPSNDYTIFNAVDGTIFIEAYKALQGQEDIFYACSPLQELVTALGVPTRDINTSLDIAMADTYVIKGSDKKTRFTYDKLNYDDNTANVKITYDWLDDNYADYVIESPTPCFTSKSLSTAVDAEAERNENKATFRNVIKGISSTLYDRQFVHKSGFVLDYTKDDEGIGRPSIINEKEKERTNSNVIRFSQEYVSDSNINGLGSFDQQDKYVISPERGPITALVRADSVLYAIHPRTITAMYIGEAFIKQSDGSDIITKTDGLIGQDRPLGGSLGSIFPESIVSQSYVDPETNAKSTRVYGFDIYAGEPWRASNNGVVGLASRYKMRKWFKEKSNQILPYLADPLSGIRIISGYHPYWDMYLITFPAVAGNPAITVGFSEKSRRWTSFYSFAPEHYQHIDNKLVSFKNGVPYIHDTNALYNNWYGTSYNSEATFVCNVNYPKDKVFRTITEESNKAIYIPSMTTPDGQDTLLRKEDFKKKGDNYFADMWRDKNSFVTPGKIPMVHGKEMAGKSLEVKLEIPASDGLAQIQSVNVGFIEVEGNLNV